MHFKTVNFSCRRVSECTDDENKWTLRSESIFVFIFLYIAKDRAEILMSVDCLRNRELHFIYDLTYT